MADLDPRDPTRKALSVDVEAPCEEKDDGSGSDEARGKLCVATGDRCEQKCETNAAEILRGFSFTELVDPIWNGIKNTVSFVGDNFMLMKDIIVGSFTLEITRIVNGFKAAFERVANFVNNLGDELYLLIAKNLRFKLDPIVITNPITGNPLFTIPGFDAGVGTAETISAAEERITNRNTESAARIEGLNNEVAEMMKAQQARLTELGNSFQSQVLVAPNNSQTTNQTNNATVLNSNGMPSTVDAPMMF